MEAVLPNPHLPNAWGGWVSKLLKNSPTGYSCSQLKPFISIESVGFLQDSITHNRRGCRRRGSEISSDYLKLDPTLTKCPPIEKLSHSFMDPDWDAVRNQIFLFDKIPPDIPEHLQKLIQASSDEIYQFLHERGVRAKYTEYKNVEWNMNATNGYGYKHYKYKRVALFDPEFIAESERFWRVAHKENARPLWKISGKKEYLPNEKLDTKNCRTFEIPPTILLQYMHRCQQYFTKQLYALVNWPVMVGMTMSFGGFNHMMKRMEQDFVKFMGDVSKWDKDFHWKIRKYCLEIERMSIDESYTHQEAQEFAERLAYCYLNKIGTFCLAPWGEVVFIPDKMKSGDNVTTRDNCIGHLIVFLSYLKYYRPGFTIYHLGKDFTFCLYSDDHIGSSSERLAFLTKFTLRSSFYRALGFTLKEADDRVQKSIEGLTFLGATAVKYEDGFGPQFSLSRIWSSIVKKGERGLSAVHYFDKLRSLLLLSTFNGRKAYEEIKELVEKQRKRLHSRPAHKTQANLVEELSNWHLDAISPYFIPTYDYSVAWWLGRESALPTVFPVQESNVHRDAKQSY